MKKSISILAIIGFISISAAFTAVGSKYISKAGHISFYSHTEFEDITANNYKVVSTIDPSSGVIVFSVSMQAFEFELAMMQKHYNSSKFLDTKTYPKAKLKGTIINLADIDFSKDGTYNAMLEGELDLHGVTKQVREKGTITVKGDEIIIDATMKITLADYNIAFTKGKPSTNVAKTIDVSIKAEHKLEN